MNLRALRLQGAFSYLRPVDVELPPRGVVLVTGANGAGKSGLFIEAPMVALWGKTARGTPPWIDSSDRAGASGCIATATFDGLEVTRLGSSKKVTHALAWRVQDDGTMTGHALDALVRLGGIHANNEGMNAAGFTYETATKAQEALCEVVGSLEVWRRTRVFSSSDAAHFSEATDAERKRLLESVVGVDGFDAALERCREDLRSARLRLNEAAHKAAVAEVLLGERREAHTRAEARWTAASAAAIDTSGRSAVELQRMLEQTGRDLAALGGRERAALFAEGEASAAAASANRQVTGLETAKGCPACGQAIAAEHLERLRALAADLNRKATAARDVSEGQRRQIANERIELEGEQRSLSSKLAARRALEAEALRRAGDVAELEAQALEALDLAEAQEECRRILVGVAGEKAAEVTELEAVEFVLGLRGARALVLGRALPSIEALGNAYLRRLGMPGLEVQLSPFTEKKSGGVTDAVRLEVLGAGGGHGYRASSQGERRRIDVALLLALADVHGARLGLPSGGTLFFDEVLDGVDADGREPVCRLLSDLAQDRVVIVVTHNEELARGLPAAVRFHVEKGQVVAL